MAVIWNNQKLQTEVKNFSIETTGGFDVGYAAVDGCELTFFSDMMEEGLDVYVIAADNKNLKLSPTMYAPELLQATEM